MRGHVKRDVDKPLDAAAREVGGEVSSSQTNSPCSLMEIYNSFMERLKKNAGTWSDEQGKKEIALFMDRITDCVTQQDDKRITELFARLRNEPMTKEEIKRIFLTPPLEIQRMSPSERRALDKRICK